MKQAVADVYHSSGFEGKGLAVVDLSETSQSPDEITITIQTVTGDKGNETPSPTLGVNGPFIQGDDWWYGELLGHCDPHTPSSTDAAIKLYTAMNTYYLNKMQDCIL
ncbi:MAG: hypothetical protein R2764_16000 [Bacteroidales bacterium]